MERRDIVIGLGILILIAGVVYIRQKNSPTTEITTTPQTLSVQDQIEQKFNTQIPDDVEKAELKDVSGGTASGIATRKYVDGTFDFNVLADLSDPEDGKFYEAWLVKGNEGEDDYSIVPTAKFTLAKGGWMLEYKSSTDYTDHSKILVTLESKLDNTPEETILEGSF